MIGNSVSKSKQVAYVPSSIVNQEPVLTNENIMLLPLCQANLILENETLTQRKLHGKG